MYEAHFNLKREPFAMTPDPYCLFGTESHREALYGLTYAVLDYKGFLVLTGDAGTGKTTLLSRLLRSIPSTRAVFSLVLNPTLKTDEFLESVLLDFGVENIPSSKIHRLMRLQDFLLAAEGEGKACVLVVDEAHKLSADVLEEIRLLTNFENPNRKLLQIVLAGQPELRNILNREDLRQLKQRIALRFDLKHLSSEEVDRYMRFRWHRAGADGELPFEGDAIQTIASASAGLPRIINAVCDNALMLAFAAGERIVTAAHAGQALRDLDLAQADGAPNQNGDAKSNGMQSHSGANALPGLHLPPPEHQATPSLLGLRALDRYIPPEHKKPFLMRWASRFGFTSHVRQNPWEREN